MSTRNPSASWRQKLQGFYAILDRNDSNLAELLVDPNRGGASILQLRWKGSSADTHPTTRQLIDAATMARDIAHRHGALFVVNDRLDIALAVDAEVIHLGQDDLSLADAQAIRARSGRHDLIIGISTHDEQQVMAAITGGADYIAYGPVFTTRTKHNPDPVQGLDRLRRAVELASPTPVVAIGGITPDTAAAVASTGAAAACSIAGVLAASDPAAAAQKLGTVFTSLQSANTPSTVQE